MRLLLVPLLGPGFLSGLLCAVSASSEDVQYYMKFPAMTEIPQSTDEAVVAGFVRYAAETGSNCTNGGVGNMYVHGEEHESYREHGLYPALFFRHYDNQLAGVVFAMREDFVAQRADFLNNQHPWSNEGLVGQIYYFQDPTTVCLEDAPADPSLGVYMHVAACIPTDPDCIPGIKKIPDHIGTAENLSSSLNLEFTNQLCLEGMGDHYTYGHCARSYAYVVLVGAAGGFSGIVNSVHLNETALAAFAKEMEANSTWESFVGVDADVPAFLRAMNGLDARYPTTSWGLPESIEAVPFFPLRGLIFDDEILPLGAACGEEGKVGYADDQAALAPDCYICQTMPRILLHVYPEQLPGRDYQTCSLPNRVTTEGLAKDVTRCGLCQVYARNVASKATGASQCEVAREIFEGSCGLSAHYGEGANYTCDPLEFLDGRVLGFDGGGLTDEEGEPCVWASSVGASSTVASPEPTTTEEATHDTTRLGADATSTRDSGPTSATGGSRGLLLSFALLGLAGWKEWSL